MSCRSLLSIPFLTILMLQSVHAIRVPLHVYPDSKSTVLDQVEIEDSQLDQYPKVLDADLEGDWYWTTRSGEYTGYVNKRDMKGRKGLKDGTLIRVNPTKSSWILTKYEPQDDIKVRSRLSVGRVSINKEIPVYFQILDSIESNEKPPKASPIVVAEKAAPEKPKKKPVEKPSTPIEEVVEKPKPIEKLAVVAETKIEEPKPQEIKEESKKVEEPSIAVIPEVAEPAPKPVMIDPLLEEKPRIPAQDLVDMAPPPSDMYQEFEGFLRLVNAEDNHSEAFKYQLETKSGRRIVYIDTTKLVGTSYDQFLEQWINIRGTLEETQPDFTLFIQAKNIWVAP